IRWVAFLQQNVFFWPLRVCPERERKGRRAIKGRKVTEIDLRSAVEHACLANNTIPITEVVPHEVRVMAQTGAVCQSILKRVIAEQALLRRCGNSRGSACPPLVFLADDALLR